MVKTKRTSARTALLASASLVLAAHGADAAIGFTAGAGATHAFATSVTLDCATLYFDIASGALVDGDAGVSGAAATPPTHAKGYAVNNQDDPTTFEHCDTEAGFYLHTVATSASSGDALVVQQAPIGWYALGGVVLTTGNVVDVLASALVPATGLEDDIEAYLNAKLFPCYAVLDDDDRTDPTTVATTAEAGSVNGNACVTAAGYYIRVKDTLTLDDRVLAGNARAQKAPIGWYALGGVVLTSDNVVDVLASALVPATALADASTYSNAKLSACPFGGTTTSTGRSLLTECVPDCATTTSGSNAEDASGTCRCKANYYGTPKDTNGATVLAVTTTCTACDAGKTAVAGSTASSACTGAPAAAATDTAASGAAGMSVLAAISAMAAAQLVL